MISNQPAKFRLVLIEVMEATGNIMFSFLNQLTKSSSLNLQFCGELHLSHESGHAISCEQDLIDTLIFTEDKYVLSVDLIQEAFEAFYQSAK